MEKDYPIVIRITHWFIVILFIISVFTALMNEFWYSKETIMKSLEFSYPMLGLEDLLPDEKLFIARMERRFGWESHFYIGILLSFNFIIMFLYSIIIKRKKNKIKRNYFFSLIMLMLMTGLILYLRSFMTTLYDVETINLYYENNGWIISQGLIDISRTIHRYTAYILSFSIIMHIIIVIHMESKYKLNLVSKMIHGGNK